MPRKSNSKNDRSEWITSSILAEPVKWKKLKIEAINENLDLCDHIDDIFENHFKYKEKD